MIRGLKGCCLPATTSTHRSVFAKSSRRSERKTQIWCFSILPGHDSLKRHFVVDCADRMKHLMTDERSINALSVARRHAIGQAIDKKLAAARDATRDIARDAALNADSGDERAWQAARLIELTEAGEWSPVKPFG